MTKDVVFITLVTTVTVSLIAIYFANKGVPVKVGNGLIKAEIN